jgi:hypothetical protein
MPRASNGAYLILRRARKKNGRTIARAVFIIRDRDKHIATGCLASQAEEARLKLAECIQSKYQPYRKERGLEQIFIADVLSNYDDDCGDEQADRKKFDGWIARLNEFWGNKTIDQVTTAECRAYMKWRGNRGGARRDLEDLRAAINHHAEENLHRAVVKVWLPDRGLPRGRRLTRSEMAKLLWICSLTLAASSSAGGATLASVSGRKRALLAHRFNSGSVTDPVARIDDDSIGGAEPFGYCRDTP